MTKSAEDREALERKVIELGDALANQMKTREQAEERVAEVLKRATQAEESLERTSQEHADLQDKHDDITGLYRRAMEKLNTLSYTQEMRDVGERSDSAQLDELKVSRDQHLRALEQAQSALTASSARAEEVQGQWRRANDDIERLQADIAELSRDLESRTAEADAANARLKDVENAWAKSREEADTLRALTTGSLGELLDYHRDLRADEERVARVHTEKTRILELETASLRNLLREANQRVDDLQEELGKHRKHSRTLETEQSALRSQIAGVRSQLTRALEEAAQARKDANDREADIRHHAKVSSETELRLKTFRNYLAENGIVVDEDEIASSANGGSANRLYEVEAKLAERTQDQEALERKLREAENSVNSLHAELSRTRDQLNGSDEAGEERVVALESKLAQAEASHKERLQVMEQDYRTAVMCVK